MEYGAAGLPAACGTVPCPQEQTGRKKVLAMVGQDLAALMSGPYRKTGREIQLVRWAETPKGPRLEG